PQPGHEAGEHRPLDGVRPAERVAAGGAAQLPPAQREEAHDQRGGQQVLPHPGGRQQPAHALERTGVPDALRQRVVAPCREGLATSGMGSLLAWLTFTVTRTADRPRRSTSPSRWWAR